MQRVRTLWAHSAVLVTVASMVWVQAVRTLMNALFHHTIVAQTVLVKTIVDRLLVHAILAIKAMEGCVSIQMNATESLHRVMPMQFVWTQSVHFNVVVCLGLRAVV